MSTLTLTQSTPSVLAALKALLADFGKHVSTGAPTTCSGAAEGMRYL